MYLSVPVPITVALIIWLGKFSVLFLFTIIFVVIDHLLLHINSGISFSSFMKNTVRILIETTMTHSIINLGKTDVFNNTVVGISFLEHLDFLHLALL